MHQPLQDVRARKRRGRARGGGGEEWGRLGFWGRTDCCIVLELATNGLN